MHFTLLVPGALVPSGWASELTRELKAPCLTSRLARASLESEMDAPDELRGAMHLAWLGPRLFGSSGPVSSDVPTAAYAFAALNGRHPAAGLQLFHADPVHFGFARDHLVVEALVDAVDTELSALFSAANELCIAQGAQLQLLGRLGFLSVKSRWDLMTTPRAAAWGQPVDVMLPTGNEATRWSRLHNEIQMIWHAHPVNLARENAGRPAINGLWLSGGGTWRALPQPAFTAIHAEEPEWRGAAAAAGVRVERSDAAARDGSLVIRPDCLRASSQQDWAAWLAAIAGLDTWFARQPADSVDLVLAGRNRVRSFRCRPRDALRFWRSTSLASALAE